MTLRLSQNTQRAAHVDVGMGPAAPCGTAGRAAALRVRSVTRPWLGRGSRAVGARQPRAPPPTEPINRA